MLENQNDLLAVIQNGEIGYMFLNGNNRTFLFGPFAEAQNGEMVRRKLRLIDDAYKDPVLDTGWVRRMLEKSLVYSFATDPLPEGMVRFCGVSIEPGVEAKWETVADVSEFVERYVVKQSE